MVEISLQPEYVLSIGGFRVPNSLLTAILTSVLLIAITAMVRSGRSRRFRLFFEGLFDTLLGIMDLITGGRQESKKTFSLVTTFFLFIVTANWLALVPGFLGSFTVQSAGRTFALLKSPTADLNTTVALALISLAAVELASLRALGLKGFAKRFVNISSAPLFIAGLFELLSEAIRLISLALRLFGNIFGGEAVIMIISFLTPFLAPAVFYLAEFFVGLVQAAIFAVLTLAYTKTATTRAQHA